LGDGFGGGEGGGAEEEFTSGGGHVGLGLRWIING
jgi:hypothetical protein